MMLSFLVASAVCGNGSEVNLDFANFSWITQYLDFCFLPLGDGCIFDSCCDDWLVAELILTEYIAIRFDS